MLLYKKKLNTAVQRVQNHHHTMRCQKKQVQLYGTPDI